MKLRKNVAIAAIAILILFTSCTKRAAPVAAAPAPQPASTPLAAPVAQQPAPATPVITEFTAEPSSILQGQSATLRWQVAGDVTSVTIDQVGAVDSKGIRSVSPKTSTVYNLIANGPGPTKTATLAIRVLPPPPPVSSDSAGSASRAMLEEKLSAELHDVYFDYASSGLGENARQSLLRNASALKAIITEFPNVSILLEGHCDDRGSAEYNLALGDLRASSTKQVLMELGISSDRVRLVSYGKEQPQCTDANEGCWQRNRRVHFAPASDPETPGNRKDQ
jgi:peptidoglycan-associated lipoprotein